VEFKKHFAFYSPTKILYPGQAGYDATTRDHAESSKGRIACRQGRLEAEDHPELVDGAAEWICEIRQDSAKRYEEIERYRKAE
jgi:hypothetical protein